MVFVEGQAWLEKHKCRSAPSSAVPLGILAEIKRPDRISNYTSRDLRQILLAVYIVIGEMLLVAVFVSF